MRRMPAVYRLLFICSNFPPENERHFHSVPLFFVSLSFRFLLFSIQFSCMHYYYYVFNSLRKARWRVRQRQRCNCIIEIEDYFPTKYLPGCESFKAWAVPSLWWTQRRVNVMRRKYISVLFFHVVSLFRSSFFNVHCLAGWIQMNRAN